MSGHESTLREGLIATKNVSGRKNACTALMLASSVNKILFHTYSCSE